MSLCFTYCEDLYTGPGIPNSPRIPESPGIPALEALTRIRGNFQKDQLGHQKEKENTF